MGTSHLRCGPDPDRESPPSARACGPQPPAGRHSAPCGTGSLFPLRPRDQAACQPWGLGGGGSPPCSSPEPSARFGRPWAPGATREPSGQRAPLFGARLHAWFPLDAPHSQVPGLFPQQKQAQGTASAPSGCPPPSWPDGWATVTGSSAGAGSSGECLSFRSRFQQGIARGGGGGPEEPQDRRVPGRCWGRSWSRLTAGVSRWPQGDRSPSPTWLGASEWPAWKAPSEVGSS